MGADAFGINPGFNSATIQPQFGGELARIMGQSDDDRVAIRP